MIVGIHIDLHKGFNSELERYEKILDFNGIDHVRMDVSKPNFWQQVKELDLFVFSYNGTVRQQQIAHTIIPIIEKDLGIPCFPNSLTSWLYDDKVREFCFLKEHSFPVIPTWIFWEKSEALKWLESAAMPVVYKLKSGASSENVVLVKQKSYGRRLIRKMFGGGIISGHVPGVTSLKWRNMFKREYIKRYGGKIRHLIKGEEGNPFEGLHQNYILFQKFLPNNEIDTRITVIGSKASGLIRHVRKNDFRASGSGKLDWHQSNVDQRCIEIATYISRKIGFTMMCYDFLFDEERRPLVSEISYRQPDWEIWKRSGYWDANMNWHEGHYWPQYHILQDMLNLADLKQPEMKPDYLPPGVSEE